MEGLHRSMEQFSARGEVYSQGLNQVIFYLIMQLNSIIV
jgi:hypothetical protein